MADRSEILSEQLDELRQDVRDLWTALTHDPKKQARKERAWMILSAALGTVATLLARRTAAKAWATLTGEPPPNQRRPR